MNQPIGELYDLGYQHYDGPREGRMRARKTLLINGLRTALGLGRGAKAKILPLLLFFAVMSPAAVLVLIVSITGELGGDIPGHAGYYEIVALFLIIFSAIIAPELIIPDRRDRVLDLYLVRPITPTDYILSRWLSFFSVTLLLVYSGQVLLLVGFVLAGEQPFEYLHDNWLDVPRFLAGGLIVTAFATTLPMAVATFTSRRAYAAAIVIGLFIIAQPVSSILTAPVECQREERVIDTPCGQVSTFIETDCEPLTGDNAKWFTLLQLTSVPIHLNDMIFPAEEATDNEFKGLVRELPKTVPIAWYLLLTAGPGFILWRKYRRMAA